MNLGIGKRSLLGLAAGALMTLGVAAPAFATVLNTDQTVTVSGSDAATLVFTIDTGSVGLPTLDPATPCAIATNVVKFDIKSNLPYSGSVNASKAGTSDMPVTQLHWMRDTTFGTQSAGCGSTAFASGANTWFASQARTADDNFSNSYALDVLYTNGPGTVSMALVYNVTQ